MAIGSYFESQVCSREFVANGEKKLLIRIAVGGKILLLRAVRIGQHVYIAGTTSTDDRGEVIGAGDAYEQAVNILRKIETVLARAGASLGDICRTRVYVTDISLMDDVGRAHREFFKNIRPAKTLVEVSALASPEMLVEIEAEAILSE